MPQTVLLLLTGMSIIQWRNYVIILTRHVPPTGRMGMTASLRHAIYLLFDVIVVRQHFSDFPSAFSVFILFHLG